MLNISGIIGKFVKNSSQRELDRLESIVDKINRLESEIKTIPDETRITATSSCPRSVIQSESTLRS